MAEIQVFLDTDIIISALLSSKGASYILMNDAKVKKIISNTITEEVIEVSSRENISKETAKIILKKVQIFSLYLSKGKLLKKYSKYVFDEEDSHVIAGAHISKSEFLLTHNMRHYCVAKIRNDLGIKVMKPGEFLQYLRSQ